VRDAFSQEVPSGDCFTKKAVDKGGIATLETEQNRRRAVSGRGGRGKRAY
jgi:hypothetical protein